jgi:hypothetical protein
MSRSSKSKGGIAEKENIVMAKSIVAGELYESITGQLFELGRQLRQPNGYPFNLQQLKAHLQAAIEGRFAPGEVYSVTLGGKTTTDQIVKIWKDVKLWVNDYITQANFPLNPHDEATVEIEIIDPDCSFSEEEGLEYLKAAGLERPTSEHALRFAEQCGLTTTGDKPFIIFLHEPWQDPFRDRRVVFVDRNPDDRSLDLGYPDDGFEDGCVLAGVRLRKQPQS